MVQSDKNMGSREQLMKKRIINVMILAAAITFLTVLAFYVRAGVTADSVAVLRTTGMTCGSCSSKITTALQTLKGVSVAEVDVDGGWVVVGYDTMVVKPEVLAERSKEPALAAMYIWC
jgi:copper chaperone CopZ